MIAVDGRIVSSGYNGAAPGEPHCDHACDCENGWWLDFTFPHSSDYTRPAQLPAHEDGCKSLKSCDISLHAEENAIRFAWEDVRLAGSTLYTTHSPCEVCAHMILSVGIARVVYGTYYRLSAGRQTLVAAGVCCDLLELSQGL